MFNKWWTFLLKKSLLCYIDIMFGYKVLEPPVLLNYCILKVTVWFEIGQIIKTDFSME